MAKLDDVHTHDKVRVSFINSHLYGFRGEVRGIDSGSNEVFVVFDNNPNLFRVPADHLEVLPKTGGGIVTAADIESPETVNELRRPHTPSLGRNAIIRKAGHPRNKELGTIIACEPAEDKSWNIRFEDGSTEFFRGEELMLLKVKTPEAKTPEPKPETEKKEPAPVWDLATQPPKMSSDVETFRDRLNKVQDSMRASGIKLEPAEGIPPVLEAPEQPAITEEEEKDSGEYPRCDYPSATNPECGHCNPPTLEDEDEDEDEEREIPLSTIQFRHIVHMIYTHREGKETNSFRFSIGSGKEAIGSGVNLYVAWLQELLDKINATNPWTVSATYPNGRHDLRNYRIVAFRTLADCGEDDINAAGVYLTMPFSDTGYRWVDNLATDIQFLFEKSNTSILT